MKQEINSTSINEMSNFKAEFLQIIVDEFIINGLSKREIANKWGISYDTLRNIISKYENDFNFANYSDKQLAKIDKNTNSNRNKFDLSFKIQVVHSYKKVGISKTLIKYSVSKKSIYRWFKLSEDNLLNNYNQIRKYLKVSLLKHEVNSNSSRISRKVLIDEIEKEKSIMKDILFSDVEKYSKMFRFQIIRSM